MRDKKGVFLLYKNTDLGKFKQNLSENFDKICEINLTLEDFDFNKDKFIKNILKKANQTDLNGEFMVVLGFENEILYGLNLEIAKNLNLPIVTICNDEEINGLNFLFETQNLLELWVGNLKQDSSNLAEILDNIKNFKSHIITPLAFENRLFNLAKSSHKNIILPESEDERVLRACDILLESGSVNLTLLGDSDEILKQASELNLPNLNRVKFINHTKSEFLDEFADELFELRKSKGLSLDKAKALVRDRVYFATMMVHKNLADGMVCGATTTTAETIRPALQIIKTKPGITTVSGAFLMCFDKEMLIFADCALLPNPDEKQLSDIAISSAKTAKNFGLEPRVAMLSYSSGSSGCGESVDKIKNATLLAKQTLGESVDGPLQFDAAYNQKVAKLKMPNSKVAGKANVYIFPDLNAGNICYKAAQRLAGGVAIGPVLQGLNKPINDLSRGCLVEDIVNTVLLTAIQAKGE
ncbi:MAG: phosphate acetyltransferase [Campylobacter sp.]|nr:phosphate acetyltransferase [Campylobacter sp.]